jgi:hypothetical protein
MRARQKLAANRLSGFEMQTNEKCYHLWLTLPAHWRLQTFVTGLRSLAAILNAREDDSLADLVPSQCLHCNACLRAISA